MFLIPVKDCDPTKSSNLNPHGPPLQSILSPISDNDNQQSRVENNYVRWLQSSGADLISIHPWTTNQEIDILLTKVNGVLLQGNPNNINIQSSYYKIAKYLYNKIIEINDSGIKMPLIAFGDDLSLLSSIISEDNISIKTELKYPLHEPTKIKLFNSPEKTILLNELEEEDMKALEKEYILPNNLKRIISVKNFLTDFHLNQKFNVIATSKTKDGKDFVIAVCNFTPEVRHGYRIGVPREGVYEEVFNTDETRWGGSGVQNTGKLETEAVPWQWRDNSLVLTLPPLATVYLKFREEKKKPRAKKHVESRRDIK